MTVRWGQHPSRRVGILGPTLWDKTLPYYARTPSNLSTLDLQEFLSEYGIPIIPSPQHKAGPTPTPTAPWGPPVDLIRAGHLHTFGHGTPNSTARTARPGDLWRRLLRPPPGFRAVPGGSGRLQDPLLQSVRNTPSPIDPESIQVPLSYEPDPADLALSSVPRQEMFDPRKRKFTDEELKPQPMIKKARKIFVPDEMKQDEKYWTRRRKNNMAAKRSRDARRLKENQIAIRASFLEKENSALRLEVADLRKELNRCKNILSKYDP
ncbi:hepatic leukemia factor-like [Leucoraja erinacea]|uniref:hepatic leukemia factor-like n=1 Tax=Leucoraja erinaceus TaxID=7782 RepID=UPI002456D7AF|nr:hepatic leukemia factor-like [Leucoraja erinacea]